MATELDLCSLSQSELDACLKELGEPDFRARQPFSWPHQKKAQQPEEMSNLPKSLRETLKEHARLPGLVQEVMQVSESNGTEEYPSSLPGGDVVESVLMRYNYGNSVCVSSQVGCRMGYRFCASTVDDLARSLTTEEMLAQVYATEREIEERVLNVVVMGGGEPMDNYDNVVCFIGLLSDRDGLSISQRDVTVSACGLMPEIQRFADEKLQVTLALSLHAADDATRQRLTSIANRYAFCDVLGAYTCYFGKTGRRVSFEYGLVAGVNDTPAEAAKLIALLQHRKDRMDLIPVSPVVERSLEEPSLAAIHCFRDTLERNGINVTIRKEMGRDIDGACGQLRRRYRDKKEQGDTKEKWQVNAVAPIDRGRVRNSNQDIMLAENHPVGALPDLYIVVDGMGGHHTGDYCPQTLITRTASAMRESEGELPLPAFRGAVLFANESLFTEAKRHTELEGMGSTLVAVFLEEQSATVLNIGDSRCYAGFTDGNFRQVIRDHSYVEEMVNAGKMQRGSEACKKSKNIIVRTIGISAEVQMDLFEPPIENLTLPLLCTDGPINILGDMEIREVLNETIILKRKTKKLTQTANMKGGRDNISIVLVDLREEAGAQ